MKIVLIGLLSVLLVVSGCGYGPPSETQESAREPTANHQIGKMYSSVTDTILSYQIEKSSEELCDAWRVPARDKVLVILSELTKVNSEVWNECFGDWSCGVSGKLILGGIECHYRLDAAGWIIINNGSNQEYFVCPDGLSCWEMFPSECFCDAEWTIKD